MLQRVQQGRGCEPIVSEEDVLLVLIPLDHANDRVERSAFLAAPLLLSCIDFEAQQVVFTGQAVDLVSALVWLRGYILLDGRSALERHHGLVQGEKL